MVYTLVLCESGDAIPKCYSDGCKAIDAHTATMMEAFSCTRTLGPIRVTAESPRKHDNLLFFLFWVVESRPCGPSIDALRFLLVSSCCAMIP